MDWRERERLNREPAPSTLSEGDRVLWTEEHALGTVSKISKSGYVHIDWDVGVPFYAGGGGYFSPGRAAQVLKLAEGEDALPRHVWCFDPPASIEEPICVVCKVKQTDDNEFGACK